MSSIKTIAEATLTPVQVAIRQARADWIGITLFSCAINILMLAGPIFMLQVYDRVLTSGSLPTLSVLYGLIVFLYAVLGIFTFYRTRVMSRVGFRIDNQLMDNAQRVRLFQEINQSGKKSQPVADLSRLRQFIGSPGLAAFFDLPWVPFYILIVFIMHPWLGWLTVTGVLLITLFTLANESLSKRELMESTRWDLECTHFSETSRDSADAIYSMGMTAHVVGRWKKLRRNSLSYAQRALGTSEALMSASKSIRLLLQSSILGLGAYLAIFELITPGTMIAASIIGGRALSPIDQVVGNWRHFLTARQAYKRLHISLDNPVDKLNHTTLPVPKGRIKVTNLYQHTAIDGGGDAKIILHGLNFSLEPGDGLGVIGSSASGKSSLARLLVGIWMPSRGNIRLDGATYDQWDRDILGKHIGYLPQTVKLLSGSIKENIARFNPDANDIDIIEAAKIANVHELILQLPDGYESTIGGNTVLSGGQIQRIALARALYGNPKLIVLDEPNSNLDAEGEAALTAAISTFRKMGSIVIVMAHRPSAIASVNKILMLNQGKQQDFGLKNDVIARVTKEQNKMAVES